MKKLHTVFYSGWIDLHSHLQCMNVLFSPHPLKYLLFLVSLIIAILTRVMWYHSCVFIILFLLIFCFILHFLGWKFSLLISRACSSPIQTFTYKFSSKNYFIWILLAWHIVFLLFFNSNFFVFYYFFSTHVFFNNIHFSYL